MLVTRHLPLFVACLGFLTGSAIGATSESLNPLDALGPNPAGALRRALEEPCAQC